MAFVPQAFVTSSLNQPQKVLDAAQRCMALEVAHDPLVRATLRDTYEKRAMLTVRPVSNKTVEDWNPFARFRYITDKPIGSLRDDDFLWITKGSNEGCVIVAPLIVASS